MHDWLVQGVGFVGMALCISAFQFKNTRQMLAVQMTGNFIYVIQFILLGAYSGCAVLILQVLSSLVLCLENPGKRVWSGWKWVFTAGIVIASVLTWQDIFSIFPSIAAVAFVLTNWTKNGKTIRLWKLLCTGPGWLIYDLYVHSWAGLLSELFGIGSTLISIYRYGLSALDKKD